MARTPIHPGEHLAGELEVLALTVGDLAAQLNVSAVDLAAVVAGERAITADLAIRLGHWFGSSATFWMNLQTTYDLRRAEKALAKSLSKLPTRAMSAA